MGHVSVLQGSSAEYRTHHLQSVPGGFPDSHKLSVPFTSVFTLLRFCLSTDLSEAVDVYSDWVDACESANTT